jgi:polycystin 1L2
VFIFIVAFTEEDELVDHLNLSDNQTSPKKRPNISTDDEEIPPKKKHQENINEILMEANELDESLVEEIEIFNANKNRQPRKITDKTCPILTGTEWVQGSQICFWLSDLKQKFPSIQGLEHPSNYSDLEYSPDFTGFFVQVLNVNHNHWVCISNYLCEQHQINIYDSLNTFNQTTITNLKQILKNMMPKSKKITIFIKNVQRQENSFDCGLFSLAFSHLICNNQDPTQYIIENNTLRPHFNERVKKKLIDTFPWVYRPNKKVNNQILSMNF